MSRYVETCNHTCLAPLPISESQSRSAKLCPVVVDELGGGAPFIAVGIKDYRGHQDSEDIRDFVGR
jgi:hypothetical protein